MDKCIANSDGIAHILVMWKESYDLALIDRGDQFLTLQLCNASVQSCFLTFVHAVRPCKQSDKGYGKPCQFCTAGEDSMASGGRFQCYFFSL